MFNTFSNKPISHLRLFYRFFSQCGCPFNSLPFIVTFFRLFNLAETSSIVVTMQYTQFHKIYPIMLSSSFFPPHLHSLSLSLSLSQTHTFSSISNNLTHTYYLSLFLSITHTHTYTYTIENKEVSMTYTHYISNTLMRTFFSLSHAHTHTLSLAHRHTHQGDRHTRRHADTHTHFLSSLINRLIRPANIF